MAEKNISKVVYGGKTLIDLTADTVTADKILKGATAHDKSGAPIVGACTYNADTSDATAAGAEILSGKAAYVNGVKITGEMKNNGDVSGVISKKADSYTVPIGYHDGAGKVAISTTEQAKIIATNIRAGVSILGVTGTMSGTESAKAQAKTATPKTTAQTILPDSAQGFNYLSQVTVNAIPYNESDNPQGGLTVTIG
nr:MAG TPA_asm: tail protein [Caudoviricetes sp.]